MQVGRCNGQAALCDRTLDQVAFVGTHNSMAADGEPGWLFVAQDAGIDAQLREGVRALLIDTHYGFATPRGVATDLARDSKSREKIESEVGERFVETAERLRNADRLSRAAARARSSSATRSARSAPRRRSRRSRASTASSSPIPRRS